MMTRKFLKLIAMVAGILTATASFALNGDIFEIRPCDETGKSVDPYATIENPVTSAGKDFYFNIRLIARKLDDPDSVWYLRYKGKSGELVDNALNKKLKIRFMFRASLSTRSSMIANPVSPQNQEMPMAQEFSRISSSSMKSRPAMSRFLSCSVQKTVP